MPTEDILVLSVELPLASARQRAQALPFAVEELIAEPLSNVHIVMGTETSPRTHVAAIVSHAVMASWIAASAESAASNCRIIPDVFAIPVPTEHDWTALRINDRVLVRSTDGSGFAVSSSLFPLAWQSAGMPSIASYGENLPEVVAADHKTFSAENIDAAIQNAPIDLRQGIYAVRASREAIWLKRAALVVAAGVFLNTLLMATDLGVLRGIAGNRDVQARELLQKIAPGARDAGDVVATLNRVLQGNAGPAGTRFLPLLGKASETLQPFASQISFQSLSFNGTDNTLGISIEGPNLGVLQAVEQALSTAGLSPISGPATTSDGAAQFRVTVHGGSAP